MKSPFRCLGLVCPKCKAQAHRACRKLSKRGDTNFLRVPHAERRALTNEGVNANIKKSS